MAVSGDTFKWVTLQLAKERKKKKTQEMETITLESQDKGAQTWLWRIDS